MCGRYVSPGVAEAERRFLVHRRHWRQYERSYNVAPSDRVPVIRVVAGEREGLLMRWGLIPRFAGGIPLKYPTINAAVEKLRSASAWRGPWARRQRCILPALGFYEWHVLPGGRRRPYYITCADQPLFAFAGLWDRSTSDDGTQTLSCAVVTLPGNERMRDIHNGGTNPFRMPAILASADVEDWLSGAPARAKAVLKQYPSIAMVAHPVSSRVDSPSNNDAGLLAPSGDFPTISVDTATGSSPG
ncbi:MAG TPA: SOS response-associated peptidase [Steroidobacteraceae bacterium]|nr:SOS response-associated peptidase [Steroidobacteraceae bacterium]